MLGGIAPRSGQFGAKHIAGNRTLKAANGEKISPNGTTGISFRTMDDVTGIRFRAN